MADLFVLQPVENIELNDDVDLNDDFVLLELMPLDIGIHKIINYLIIFIILDSDSGYASEDIENEELEAVIELDLFEVENVAEPEIVYEFQEQVDVFNETPPASLVDQPGKTLF